MICANDDVQFQFCLLSRKTFEMEENARQTLMTLAKCKVLYFNIEQNVR